MAGLIRMNVRGSLLGILAMSGLLGCGNDHDTGMKVQGTPGVKAPEAPTTSPAPADPNAKAYPLKVCIVSGEALGTMGEPMRFTYKGQEIKLCCKGCEKKFHAEADKFLEKIAGAAGK
jgi:hypothetical protein